MEQTELIVNGETYPILYEKTWNLLYVLREVLGLTGTKCGCSTNDCGACRVIVDGEAKNSCVLMVKNLAGKHIETIEGLSRGIELHPIQQAFIDAGAVQCGFCTPGMIMSAKALLDANPDPTEEEIRAALEPNLCRCTGYVKIVEAVQLAARRMGVLAEETVGQMPPRLSPDGRAESFGPSVRGVIGAPTPVFDARLKVSGQLRYVDDMKLPGMLHAKILLSPKAHATIVSIDTGAAEALPGVRAVVTYRDAPAVRFNGNGEDWDILESERVLDSRVRYVGDKVCAVAADTEAIAAKALKLIKVEYEDLPAYFDPEEAAKPDAVRLHDWNENGNILWEVDNSFGDLDEGFSRADFTLEKRFEVPAIHHAAMETHGCIASFDADGKLTVWSSSQDVFGKRRNLAKIFGLPYAKVRVLAPALGGGFGGKIDASTEPVAALLSLKTGRPVKCVYTRQEDIQASPTRHAETIYARAGFKNSGELTALDYTVYINAGAHSGGTMSVAWAAGGKFFKLFKCPNMRNHAIPVYTNRQNAGAMRGFGSPQVFWVFAQLVREAAERCGRDATELYSLNLHDPDTMDQRGEELGNFRAKDCLARAKELFGWDEAVAEARASRVAGAAKRIGVGCAVAPHGSSLYGVMPDTCGITIKMNLDGSITLFSGMSDMGNGSNTVQRMIVSEVLALPLDNIALVHTDTELTGYDVGIFASRGTYVGGGAAYRCAEKVAAEIRSLAADLLSEKAEALELRANGVGVTGDPGRWVSMEEVAHRAHELERDIVIGGNFGSAAVPASAGAHLVKVEIDLETGAVIPLVYAAVHDVGRALNPMGLEGQVHGGIQMGLGYALSEGLELKDDGSGALKNRFLRDCHLFRATDMPRDIRVEFLDSEEHTGPFGAKSVGECGMVPVAGAVSAAVADALGYTFTKLPITEEAIRCAASSMHGS